MRRILIGLVVLLALAVAAPPLWFAVAPEPERPALPPAQQRVTLPGGVRVHVVEAGRGAPVVLVHGLPGNAWDWRETTAALVARGRRALAYDRVGYGRSDPRPDDAFTVDRNARELVALLDVLELRDATVVGWSYGGGTAIVAAHRDPSRMGRLVLVGSAGPGIEEREPPLGVRVLMSDPVFAWMRAVPPVTRALRRALSEVAFSGQPQPD
ncbi:MAG: alpha/beta fold hydrolase, partial [Myxococcota bacterium]|nr:alpha/beta fold hydrolase [Myxococcota bacterium]